MATTPEELAAIEAYLMQLQNDPFARSANDLGQGSGFLQLDEQPESWDRLGEVNDLYTDLFKTTGTYLQDYIPGLPEEVEAPERFDGYRSDRADLYRNNPAYSQLETYMKEGASFDEAVQLVSADEQFATVLPKTERGQVDATAFRNSAETYVSERAREGREFDEYDAERQAYENYVNPLSQEQAEPTVGRKALATSFGPGELPYNMPPAPLPMRGGYTPKSVGRPGPSLVEPDQRLIAGMTPTEFAAMDTDAPPGPRIGGRTHGNPRGRATTRDGGVRQPAGPKVNNRDSKGRTGSDVAFSRNRESNKQYDATLATMKKMKEQRLQESDKSKRNRMLVQAYNTLMYGE